ncbi:hypothetical protein [Streptacidiphilus sp. EB103A]|uniref:hypothetical protein n=1 Tax=Streptacidiphilus sp. EB103A TaxID=3156275 RepID=UPI003516A13E
MDLRWIPDDFDSAARRDLGVPPGVPLVGTVCRIDRQKAPLDFVRMAAAGRADHPDVAFVMEPERPHRPSVPGPALIPHGVVRNRKDRPVPGLVSHAAGPSPTGWFVADVWESEEAFQKFGEKLAPLMQAAGMPMGEPTVYQAFDVVTD